MINSLESWNYVKALEMSGYKFKKMRHFICGWLGFDDISDLDSQEILVNGFESKDWRQVEMVLTQPLDPTFPQVDPNKATFIGG